jgi:TRAP-type C4-dicarboxylate transport system permease small subunit
VINKLRGRLYHITESLSLLLGLIGYGLILIFSFQFTVEAYQVGDVTEYLYTPTWPSKLCVPLGSFFLCTRFIIQIIKNIAQAVVGVELRDLE